MRQRTADHDDSGEKPITNTAVETVVLWPTKELTADAVRDETGVWPVFTVVVDGESTAPGSPLTDLLDMPRSPGDTIANSHCSWAVDDRDEPLFRLAVRVNQPISLAMDIAVPGQCFLGLSGVLATGATVGVTTRQRARRLTARTDHRACFDEVLLLGGRVTGELGDLAKQLCNTTARA